MSEYSIRKIDSSAGITDVRYVEYTTILVPKSGGTFTGNIISPAFSATTYSGVTFYGDGTNLTGLATYVDFSSHTGDTSIHYTKGSINLSELGSSAHTHPISEVVDLQSELDGKSGNAWQVFSSTTTGQGVVTASTVNDILSFSGVNIDIYTDNTNKILTFSAATGDGGGDTFVTGTTFNSNQATVTRNDGSDVLFLTGGANVTLSNPSTNQIKIDVTSPSDNPNIRNISTTQSILTTDRTLNCTGGTITLTLPTAVGVTGKEYVIKNSGAGTITVDTTGSQTIDGSTSIEIKKQNLSRRLQSNGFNWIVI